MPEELLNILSTLYNLQVDILYEMHSIKEKHLQQNDEIYLKKIASDLKYYKAIYEKLKQIKNNLNIPMYSFNNISAEGICIKNGYLIGKKDAILEIAIRLINENINKITNEKNCMLYELGLYSSYLASKDELVIENKPSNIKESKSNDSNLTSSAKNNSKIEEFSFFTFFDLN